MKKTSILLVAAAIAISATSAFSQGTINFANNGSTLVSTNGSLVGQGTGSAALTTGSGIKLQLVYQAAPNGSLAPTAVDKNNGVLGNWKPIATLASISPLVGRFNGGQLTTGNDVTPAGNVWLEVLAWNNSAYSTLSDAIAAGVGQGNALLYVGTSSVWMQGTGDGGSVGAQNIVLNGSFTGLVMTPVPEPTTLVLGGLGAAALLAFRRRK